MTENLIDLYRKSRGICEVPDHWFEWAALSAIAACVGDRVCVDRCGEWVTPNLYVFLIGPSGSGKEDALKGIGKLVAPIEIVNFWAGQITGPALIDWLNRKNKRGYPINEKMYLFTEELAHAVGGKEQAELLVRTMTDFYSLKGYPVRQGTRTRGQIKLSEPLMNWAAGSTEEWLKMAISKEAISSGFWARVIGVRGERDIEKRVHQIERPTAYDEMVRELTRRLRGLSNLPHGERLLFSAEARMLQKRWYETRQFSEDEAARPTEFKGDMTLHKVAACLKLGDIDIEKRVNVNPTVEVWHVERALEMLTAVWEDVPYFMDLAAGAKLYKLTERVTRYIQARKEVPHAELSRKMRGRGAGYAELEQIINDLLAGGKIFKVPTKSNRGTMYQWRGDE